MSPIKASAVPEPLGQPQRCREPVPCVRVDRIRFAEWVRGEPRLPLR